MIHAPRNTTATARAHARGNTLVLVTAILVLLVIVATAFLVRAQSGRAQAAAQQKATGRQARVGQKGVVRCVDLANTDSVLAVQTHDWARRTKDGFELIGRASMEELRGCSLLAEDLFCG